MLKMVNFIPKIPIKPKVQIHEIAIGIKVNKANSIRPNDNRRIRKTIPSDSLTSKLKSSLSTRTKLSVIYFLSKTTKFSLSLNDS